jgi:acyl-CoA reductase-like NAD-dependent aldehyde dehydrogenase
VTKLGKVLMSYSWVNTHFELDPRAPFGGFKESGIGTEFGVGGLKSYCNSQTLYLKK